MIPLKIKISKKTLNNPTTTTKCAAPNKHPQTKPMKPSLEAGITKGYYLVMQPLPLNMQACWFSFIVGILWTPFIILEVHLQYKIHVVKQFFIKGLRCCHCKAIKLYYLDSERSEDVYRTDHGFQPSCTKISFGLLSEMHNKIWPVSSVPDTQMPTLQKPAAFLISVAVSLVFMAAGYGKSPSEDYASFGTNHH